MREKGFAQIITLLILLLGLVVGIYLVQHQTNLLPKAAAPRATLVKLSDLVSEEKLVGSKIKDKLSSMPPVQQQPKTLTKASQRLQSRLSAGNISSCGEITSSGNYVLNQDVSASNNCIYIHDTQNVNLDCQNHTINYGYNPNLNVRFMPPLDIENVQGFSVKNCNIKNATKYQMLAYITNTSNGVIDKSTFDGNNIQVESNTGLQFSNNTVAGIYGQSNSSYSRIYNNTFKNHPQTGAGSMIGSFGGSLNTIANNTIDGLYQSQNLATDGSNGADDGILISSESKDVIASNTISNVYDSAIETTKAIQNTQIVNNKTFNAGFNAIGAYYGTSWVNNTVDSNTVDGSAYLFYIFRYDSLKQGETAIYFKDNTFSNNKFSNQASASYFGTTKQYSALVDLQNLPNGITSSMVQASNNVFKNNDFNSNIGAPVLIPTSLVVDKGGNTCQQVLDPSRPLQCINSSSPTPTSKPKVTAKSCTNVKVEGEATYLSSYKDQDGNSVSIYSINSGSSAKVSVQTDPPGAYINWKIVGVSSYLPNEGTLTSDPNDPTVVTFTAPNNPKSEAQGTYVRGDYSDYPWKPCPYVDFAVRPASSPTTPSPLPSPTPQPAKRAFITSTTYYGNLGGLSGADAKCQEKANAANLGGSWKAWLSDNSTSAASRLNHYSGPYKRVDGITVANNWDDLTDGSLQDKINITELNKPSSWNLVWTNTKIDGSIFSTNFNQTCNNFTSLNYYNKAAGTGFAGVTDNRWTNNANNPPYGCDAPGSLYCFEQ